MCLSLDVILIAQLNPQSPILESSRDRHGHGGRTRGAQAQAIVGAALAVLLECWLNAMGLPGAMHTECGPFYLAFSNFWCCIDFVRRVG